MKDCYNVLHYITEQILLIDERFLPFFEHMSHNFEFGHLLWNLHLKITIMFMKINVEAYDLNITRFCSIYILFYIEAKLIFNKLIQWNFFFIINVYKIKLSTQQNILGNHFSGFNVCICKIENFSMIQILVLLKSKWLCKKEVSSSNNSKVKFFSSILTK